mgnify:CR=1 FL=1
MRSQILKDDEILFSIPLVAISKKILLSWRIRTIKSKKRINQFPGINQQVELTDSFVVVLANQAVLERCLADWFPKQSEVAAVYPEYNFLFNTKLKEKDKQSDFAQSLSCTINPAIRRRTIHF